MIPKIIHYCWLSGDPMPSEAVECMKSWKKFMPDWKIRLWDYNSFDLKSVPFVWEAVQARKWATASDYIRLYALYTEGGIYLDSDVLIRKPIDYMLENRFFSAMETYPDLVQKVNEEGLVDAEGNRTDRGKRIHGIQIQAAVIGSEKGHPFLKDCMDYYHTQHMVLESNGVLREDKICPIVMAVIAEKYGFKYLDKEQQLDEGIHLYPADIICPQPYLMKPAAVMVHCCNASWRFNLSRKERYMENAKNIIKRFLVSIGLRKEKNIDKIR